MKDIIHRKYGLVLAALLALICCLWLVLPALAKGDGSGGGSADPLTLADSSVAKPMTDPSDTTITTTAEGQQDVEPVSPTETAADKQVRDNSYATLTGFILAGIPVYIIWRRKHSNK